MTLQEILAIRALITVAHHVPGRVRLRLDPQVRSLPAAAELGNGDARRNLGRFKRNWFGKWVRK